MGVVSIIRQIVLGLTTLFSVVELIIAARLTSQTQQYFGFTAIFCALGLAAGVISLVTLPIMLVVDFLRRGAFTSMIVVELGWLFILAVLWVATGAETVTEYNSFFPDGCNFLDRIDNGSCQETQAIGAFSLLNFAILLLYTIVLVVMSIISASRGQNVWLFSVKESFGSPVRYSMTQHSTPAPSQAQLAYPTSTPIGSQYSGSLQVHGILASPSVTV